MTEWRKLSSETIHNIMLATPIVLSNRPDPNTHIQGLFYHIRSFGDYTGLPELVKDLVLSGQLGKVVLSPNEGELWGDPTKTKGLANPGQTWVRQGLLDIGIPEDRITSPILEAPVLHTRDENRAFNQFALDHRWTTVASLCQPHQALRIMLGAVQEMYRTHWMMKYYTYCPTNTPWFASTMGSQAAEDKPRITHIIDELNRVDQRQGTGELAGFDLFFDYMKELEQDNLQVGVV